MVRFGAEGGKSRPPRDHRRYSLRERRRAEHARRTTRAAERRLSPLRRAASPGPPDARLHAGPPRGRQGSARDEEGVSRPEPRPPLPEPRFAPRRVCGGGGAAERGSSQGGRRCVVARCARALDGDGFETRRRTGRGSSGDESASWRRISQRWQRGSCSLRPRSSTKENPPLSTTTKCGSSATSTACVTGIGPHLHDARIEAAGRDLRSFGSQGEQRVAVLALVLAEARAIAEREGVRPLVLLDDVLSELDDDRRRALAELIATAGQTVITATSTAALPAEPALALVVTPGAVRSV